MSRSPAQAFLIEAAIMLHRYGTPSHRLERVMRQVADSLNVRGEFLYTPTALVISLQDESGELTEVRRVDSGPVDVDKLIQFDDLLGKVERLETPVPQARLELEQIAAAPSLYSEPAHVVACAAACATVAIFFDGSLAEVIAAGAVGWLVATIASVYGRFHVGPGLLEPFAGMVAALASLLVAHFVLPIDDRLVTLSALIVLIPGLQLTVALNELAVGHLSAGVARLAGAMVSLSTLFVGAAIVWRLGGDLRRLPAQPLPLEPYWQWIALILAPFAFAIVFRAGKRQWPIIVAVSILGVAVSRLAEPRFGIEAASFLGALAVGCGSNLYARLCDRPALVPSTPGMLILVPGSLGYRSMAALLEQQTIEGVQFAFAMLLIGVCLVGGLLTSNAIVPPKRIL
jgi:uncharacterized membrane protein YjjP (DUF1212 family)